MTATAVRTLGVGLGTRVVLAQAVGQLNETVTRIERDVQLAARGRTPSGAAIPTWPDGR